jgi:LPS sulfotransferase NodH
MTRRKFVVLTSSRTGSTWLMDMLNKVEGVHAHGELFLRQPRSKPAIAVRSDFPRFIEAPGTSALPRPLRVFSYLNWFLSVKRYGRVQADVFASPDAAGNSPLPGLPSDAIVHLVRQNYLDVVVSEELARHAGTSHSTSLGSVPLPRVRLDPASLLRRIRRLETNDQWMRLLVRCLACEHIEVAYEELLHDDRQQLNRILTFLQLGSMRDQVASTLVKRGARSHEYAIINYAEIKELLAGTRYRRFLR